MITNYFNYGMNIAKCLNDDLIREIIRSLRNSGHYVLEYNIDMDDEKFANLIKSCENPKSLPTFVFIKSDLKMDSEKVRFFINESYNFLSNLFIQHNAIGIIYGMFPGTIEKTHKYQLLCTSMNWINLNDDESIEIAKSRYLIKAIIKLENPISYIPKKIFISQPYSGTTEKERKEVRNYAKSILKELFPITKIEIINQFDNVVENELKNIAYCIDKMADADLVYFTKGYKASKGCGVEFKIANDYNLNFIAEQ